MRCEFCGGTEFDPVYDTCRGCHATASCRARVRRRRFDAQVQVTTCVIVDRPMYYELGYEADVPGGDPVRSPTREGAVEALWQQLEADRAKQRQPAESVAEQLAEDRDNRGVDATTAISELRPGLRWVDRRGRACRLLSGPDSEDKYLYYAGECRGRATAGYLLQRLCVATMVRYPDGSGATRSKVEPLWKSVPISAGLRWQGDHGWYEVRRRIGDGDWLVETDLFAQAKPLVACRERFSECRLRSHLEYAKQIVPARSA